MQINFEFACQEIAFCSVLGSSDALQNPGFTAVGLVWFRYHNAIASRLQSEHPDWSDEKLFQKTRRHVVAVLQVLGTIKTKCKQRLNSDVYSRLEHRDLRVAACVPGRRSSVVHKLLEPRDAIGERDLRGSSVSHWSLAHRTSCFRKVFFYRANP